MSKIRKKFHFLAYSEEFLVFIHKLRIIFTKLREKLDLKVLTYSEWIQFKMIEYLGIVIFGLMKDYIVLLVFVT